MEQDIIYCFETIRNNLIQNRVHQKRLQILDFSLRELDKATEKVKSIKLNSSSSLLDQILSPPSQNDLIEQQEGTGNQEQIYQEEPKVPVITKTVTTTISNKIESSIQVKESGYQDEIQVSTEPDHSKNEEKQNVEVPCEAFPESDAVISPEKPLGDPQYDNDEPQMDFDETTSSPLVTKSKECLYSFLVRDSFLFLNSLRESIKTFDEDPKLADSIKSLKLCIKTTVNTISNNSISQIREKSVLLSNLLEKRPVRFQEKMLNPDIHPLAIDFCMLFTAETIIGVGTKMITSLPRASFSIGAVVASLWTRHQNFGKIFLALLCEQCPFAIPCHPKREEGMSETEHLILCGYNLKKDGKTLESEESYLNRMRAMIMLFAASIQMPSQSKCKFLDLNHAWSWIALLLNDDPQPLITPAVLQGFLQMASYRMLEAYGRQFFKLIKFIESIFVPKIRDVTTKDMKRQTLVNLQLFIDDLLRKMSTTGQINEPEGFIRASIL